MRSFAHGTIIVLLATYSIAACTPALHSACNRFDACGSEMVCHQTSSGSPGTCEMPCRGDGDCPIGFHCDANASVGGVAHACVAR
jgi:hypothetical protein